MSEEKIAELESKFEEQETKLNNQSEELNHLTNEIIPNLKKENQELTQTKRELTDALEKSTKKYYDQLDINADLSDTLAKNGAELAVAKVRVDNLETEIAQEKESSQSQFENLNKKIEEGSPEELEKLKQENEKLNNELNGKNAEISKLEDIVPKLKSEI
ncbi:acyltransferase, partial [Methanobrevibacter sp. OttesenSCG-928-I08]|nr:acyltransferase [Methanobrevibacter sp. OttesenSCG-928-I08]